MAPLTFVLPFPAQPHKIDYPKDGLSLPETENGELRHLFSAIDQEFSELYADLKRLRDQLNQAGLVSGSTAGKAGAQGIQGPPGEDGIEGDIGPVGPVGATGATGATGFTGAQGPIGPPGDDGAGEDQVLLPPGILSIGAPSFTKGSVVFAGPSGSLAQDNAQIFWDDTNFRLGVGTAAPSTDFQVGGGTGIRTITISSGSSSGQGSILAISGQAKSHNIATAAAVLGGSNADLLLFAAGSQGVEIYTNGATEAARFDSSQIFRTDGGTDTLSNGEHWYLSGTAAAAHFSMRIRNHSTTGYNTLWMGSGNDGFIRGNASAGSFTNQLVFLTSGLTDVGFVVNNTMTLLCHGIDGTNLTEIKFDLTCDGNFKTATSQNFSWNTKAANTVFTAANDGLVIGYGHGNAQLDELQILTDSSNPPTTIRFRYVSNTATNAFTGFCVPVKKGDFYKIVLGGTMTLDAGFMVPFGSTV